MPITAEELFSAFDFSILDSPEFKEDSVREELIQPILKTLGYTAHGKNRIIRSKTLTHPFVMVGSKKRAITNFPDYLFQVDGKYSWVLDAKSPDEEIKTGENVEQTYFYAIHPDIRAKMFALCNGREFIVFEIDRAEPVLYFHMSEIERHWEALVNLLSPEQFGASTPPTKQAAHNRRAEDSDYTLIKPLGELKNVRKQDAKRHFGVHGYFTKQAYSNVQAYILNFSKPGDLVLDPYGGTGVTLIEALMQGRKAIHIDLNPLSIFMVKNTITPVDLGNLVAEYENITKEFKAHAPKTDPQIKASLRISIDQA